LSELRTLVISCDLAVPGDVVSMWVGMWYCLQYFRYWWLHWGSYAGSQGWRWRYFQSFLGDL